MIGFLIANRKLVAIALALFMAFGAGFHARTILYRASEASTLKTRLKAANDGTKKIVEFTQKWNNANVQDDCVNKPIPDDLVRLLK